MTGSLPSKIYVFQVSSIQELENTVSQSSLRIRISGQGQWLTPVILTTQEAKRRRIWFKASPGK
jgi:hypothetical protein